MSQAGKSEKGADVAFAIDALQVGFEGKVDIAVLVTGDADMISLVRALMKNGVRVVVAYFEYESGKDRAYANDRMLTTILRALSRIVNRFQPTTCPSQYDAVAE